MARASGVNYDLRKVDKYGIYDRFNFRVPLGDHGDVYDRYMIRVLEMRESIKILKQAIRDLPAGPIMDPNTKIRGFRPKAGEAYGRIEAPKGRARLLPDQRRNPEPLSLPCAPTQPHQSDFTRGHVPGTERSRHRDHPRQHRHRFG